MTLSHKQLSYTNNDELRGLEQARPEKSLFETAQTLVGGISTEIPELPEVIVGLEAPLKDLKTELLGNEGFSMLVVTAPGGCGKTTLATNFCTDHGIRDKFGKNIFFVTVSKKYSLTSIVEQLYRHKGSSIVERCKGFPHAITVVGRSVCAQPIEMWQNRLNQWSRGSSILDFETELLLCLQSSLYALDKEKAIIKECFLDLGSFPEDKRLIYGPSYII
ncbi:PREDICTED: probable disease resistance protein At5g66900-like [Fragaria vesca subsp. vesca]